MYRLFIVFVFCASCSSLDVADYELMELTPFVNTFIGTGGHGHTYPGATMPFGMMQLSPDTRLDGWDGCSGYHHSDDYIYGFSHTHLSGTGVSDYGDILLMPTDELDFEAGSSDAPGYGDHFSHDRETASPGYYSVHLDSTDIDVELTTSYRSGVHRYTFASGQPQVVIIDLVHRDEVLDSKVNLVSDQAVSGYRHSKAWANRQMLYYHMEFSRPYKSVVFEDDAKEGQSVRAAFTFDNSTDDLEIRVGISAVDEAGAKKNLDAEVGGKSFDEVRETADAEWNKQLNKILFESSDRDAKVNFYSALYHTMIAPNLYQDVDGRYRGMDLEVHQTDDFDYYTVFSLWDTYRAAHPLYTLIEQDRTNDFINTFLAKHDEGGIMPIWDLSGCYTGCMIGYHAIPVIVDAYRKGITDYDVEHAYEAMKHAATREHLGLAQYQELGYIPVEEESESVSKTLEYAYDDWCIAQMAADLGRAEDYEHYIQRAQYYKNVYDPSSQFMRGRFRNTWFAPFDPYEVNFNYTEANSWQYSFYVPQDVSGFIDLLGGKEQLEGKLDDLFSANTNISGRNQVDITGLIGQYAHGNEPSHHMAYLYNYVGRPDKTQERVNQILTEQYSNSPDGISGNEDCGQMSAWYVLSSLGIYPVTPGANQYIIGTPIADSAAIHLSHAKTLTIKSHNRSNENIYIEKATLNGQPLTTSYLTHNQIAEGGILEYYMSNQPSEWGRGEESQPVTSIDDHLITPVPFIAQGDVAFKESTTVHLEVAAHNVDIYYSTDGLDFDKYVQPIAITDDTDLYVYGDRDGVQSAAVMTSLREIDPLISIDLQSEYANQYNGGGPEALIDGVLGAKDYRTGTWQGYWNTDLDATVDLGTSRQSEQVTINFLEDQKSWIFLPSAVECWVSTDGRSYQSLGEQTIDNEIQSDGSSIRSVTFAIKQKNIKKVKLKAKTLGELPEWHIGHKHDGRSWIFADEITIK